MLKKQKAVSHTPQASDRCLESRAPNLTLQTTGLKNSSYSLVPHEGREEPGSAVSLCLEFCVPEVGGTGKITKVRFYLTSSTCKRKLNSERLCSYSWKFNYYFSRVGSIIPGGGSIRAELSGGGTTGQAAFPVCRQRASSAWRTLGKPGPLRGEEDPVSRSHTALREPMQLDLRICEVSLESLWLFHTITKSSVSHVSRKLQEFRTGFKANPG